jgi:hypothetical protein
MLCRFFLIFFLLVPSSQINVRPFYLFNAYKTGHNIIRGFSASIPREPHQKLVRELFSPFIINIFAFFRTPHRPVFQDAHCFLRGSGLGSSIINKCVFGSVVGSIVLENSIRIDSLCVKTHSSLTERALKLIPHRFSITKQMKFARRKNNFRMCSVNVELAKIKIS